ncbi:hypothetical protein COV22_04575 [Candidatus Woesearchaeota archaeon CG10_big_fil_rev_8_21_14_0_10_47_5]|nr:MAG: hypothetical protein COV22_04575 [Candidatus Woesearchaeota archaeon CG10_big_fil_rev_8_21_14_0_10_47_5]
MTAEHYLGVPIVCSIVDGCEQVLHSTYATIFGIPIALFGALYYAAVFLLTFLYVDTKNLAFLKGAVALPFAGFVASAWFVYLQAFVLEAWCQYCLISALISTLLFLLSSHVLWHSYKKRVSLKYED